MYIDSIFGNNINGGVNKIMKKLFPGNRMSSKRLLEFFDKKGFYIVLVLCIAIVGIAAVIVTTYNFNSPKIDFDTNKMLSDSDNVAGSSKSPVKTEPTQSAISTTQASNISEDSTKISDNNVKTEAANNPDAAVEATTQSPATQKKNEPAGSPAQTGKTETVSFIMPVFGEVTFEYAMDRLVYSKTLEDWRTHSGVDIGAPKSTVVKAVADGIVTDVKRDPGFGITVVIDHQNGYVTKYSNLAKDDTVTPNQKIKQGEAVGAVGDTAAFESVEATHLHFEVLKDNKNINPMDLLSIKK